MIKFKFQGLKVLANKFERASNKGVDGLMSIIDDEAEMIAKRSLRDVPVDTGKLKGSFFKKAIGSKLKRGWSIGFNEYYAAYKEFGTGTGLRIGNDYSEFSNYAENFKTTNYPENYTRQKKYLLNAFILSRRATNKKTKTAVKNLIK